MAQNIYLGNLTLSQGFYIIGSNGNSGWSVSGTGDINGDGYDDVIIGAVQASPGGVSYVIFGNSSNFINNINLASLTTAEGFYVNGITSGEASGYSVSSIGDINNDGYNDFIIGAPNADPEGITDAGISYVIFGRATGLSALDTMNLNNLITTGYGFYVAGTQAQVNGQTGISVSNAGDVNNDGYNDFIIGAHLTSNNGRSQDGTAYILLGKSVLTQTNNFTENVFLTSQDLVSIGLGFAVYGAASSDNLGLSVSNAGDLNKDGYADIILGAPNADPFSRTSAGTSYVIFSSANIALSNIDLATDLTLTGQGFAIYGSAGGDNSGLSVSFAGDVNGDGYGDVIIGAPNSANGASYIIYGKASNFSNIDLANNLALTNQGFTIYGSSVSDLTGNSVSGMGDINHDGYDDVIIGAPGANSADGTSYIIYGGSEPDNINLYNFTFSQGFIVIGDNSGSNSGYAVSGIGDFNKDGGIDLIVGSPYANSGAGETYVLYGEAAPSSRPTQIPTSTPTSKPSCPTSAPTSIPTDKPTITPTSYPTSLPSNFPTDKPTTIPSDVPTSQPSRIPTSNPTKPRELIYNFNIDTAIISTISSFAGAITLYLVPSYVLKNWGYKYKYVYSEEEKENLQRYEIGLFRKDDYLVALHKKNKLIREYKIEINNGNNKGISEGLYRIIYEHLEQSVKFKKNPATSPYKYIYESEEKNDLQGNEVGLKYSGNLPLLTCNLFCNTGKLVAYKIINARVYEFEIKISNENEYGIPKALFHAIASEYSILSNSFFTAFEENQLRDFLLITGRMEPSISVFQKIFCLYTPIYNDLGYFRGFFYGACLNFFKKIQVSLNPRISDDLFSSIVSSINHLKSEIETQTVTSVIHQEKKDEDLEAIGLGSESDTSSFQLESIYVKMGDTTRNPDAKTHLNHACIIQAVCEIKFDNPIVNDAYNKRLGLSVLKKLPFLSEETDVKQITQLGNSESYKSDKSSFNEPDINYPNHIIGTFINARQIIEYIPIMKYVSQNIVYPLVENYLPESVKNISLPEILDSKFLFTAHLGLGSLGAMMLPQETIYKGIIASTAGSAAFGFRLIASQYLSEQKQETLSNDRAMDAFEVAKYCMSTMLAYTVPSFATCALAQIVMPGYNCAELDLVTKLSFAGAECYSVYKATQVPIVPTTADVFIPYITDFIVANAAYANSYGAMSIMASVITADWMSKLAMDNVPVEMKKDHMEPIFNTLEEIYASATSALYQIIEETQEFYDQNHGI